MRTSSNRLAAISVAVSFIAVGCGSGGATSQSTSSAVTGIASADSPVSSVSLKDSATQQALLTTTPDASGGFSFDVAGLAAPFMLKADAPSGAVYAIASQSGPANVNAITTVAVAAASSTHDAENSWSGHDSHSSHDVGSVIRSLSTVLKPLFDLYGITRIGEDDEGSHLRALLHDVSFTVKSGVVTVANRATGGIIFTGPLSNLASGTFHAENMPAAPGGTPPPSCTYAYNAWASCQSDGTQTRTVASASPGGCTGTPVLSQACTYAPSSPATCQYTYSAWTACQTNGTQTRTVVTSGPTGCTGTPVLTQSCTYVPPPPTCTSFSYSAWGACQSTNTQSRTVATSSPTGCTGGSPVLTQSCTYVPPVTTCTSFTYSAWGACQSSNTQSRTVATSSPTGCTGGLPVLTQSCTYVPPVTCTLATAVPSCTACHSVPPASHTGRAMTCATCHGPVNNGSGTPSTGMTATLSGTTCRLNYPTSGTHDNGTVNFGAAQ
jgi:hypothetical protein